jgi:hypothetical protein
VKKILILISLIGIAASAKNRVGEWAAYDYYEKTESAASAGQLIREIVDSKTDRSPSGKKQNYFKVSNQLWVNGQKSKEKQEWIESEKLPGKWGMQWRLWTCTLDKNIGLVEKLKTKHGTYSTCKIKDKDEWQAVVPFGVVLSIEYTDSAFRRYELTNYGWNTKQ